MLWETRYGEPEQPELDYYSLVSLQQSAFSDARCHLLVAAVLRYRTDLSPRTIEREMLLAFPLTAAHMPDWSAAIEVDAKALELDGSKCQDELVSRHKERWECSLREWLQAHGTIPLWKNEYFGLVSMLTESFEEFQQRVLFASHTRKLDSLELACSGLEQTIETIAAEKTLHGSRFSRLRRFLRGSRDLLARSFEEADLIAMSVRNDIDNCETMARMDTQMFDCRPSREHMHVMIKGLGWPDAEGSGAGD